MFPRGGAHTRVPNYRARENRLRRGWNRGRGHAERPMWTEGFRLGQVAGRRGGGLQASLLGERGLLASTGPSLAEAAELIADPRLRNAADQLEELE